MNKPVIHTAVLAVTPTASLPMSAAHAPIDDRLLGLSMIGVDKAWKQGFLGREIQRRSAELGRDVLCGGTFDLSTSAGLRRAV